MKKPTSSRRAPAKAQPRVKAAGGPRTRSTAGGKVAGKPDAGSGSAAQLIDQRIRDLADWRGEVLARMRALILAADPHLTEEWKWAVPVWSRHGIVCTGEAYAKAVKLTFPHGASLPDPARLFNASLEGKTRRAIDIHAGETVDAGAFTALVRAAVARNAAGKA
jgi:hypothetical protein